MRRARAICLVLFLAACAPAARPPGGVAPLPPPYDLVISGGRIVDGTGAPWFYGDLAIRGDRIARVTPSGLLRDAPARERMDARGMVVAPGFIDIQGQSGGSFLFGDGRDVSKVTQGITTEILGEGGTPAPANQRTVGDISRLPPARQAVVRAFMTPRGFSRWLEAMERHGISPNVGSFLGAATVRQYVKGMALGEPTPAELDTMRAVVRRAMEDGAFGVASALIYPPGNFAGTPELIQMARAMAPYGGVYITHMRSEADQLLEAIDEAIRIGREGGVPVEIYHLKAGGLRNWPKAARAIAKIDSARAAGLDVQANMYPYIAGGTGLSSCLPPWAAADDKLLDNLRDPAMRPKIRAEVMQQTTDWENLCQLATPDGVLVLGLLKPENQVHAGKRLSEIAAAVGKDWLETAVDLLLAEEQRIGTIYFMMSEDNVKLQLTQPWLKFGTDAGGADPDSARGLTHPRAYGTYPRILGKYVRDEGVLTLEDAVRKATSAVATRLSIQDRGVLREGFYADVVVFDPTTIADRATFEEPHQLSAGVRDVFVNGVGVVRGGRHTGSRPGRVGRGPGYGGH
ncbi:MAG: D-aminoacylase [Gemmatimonadetes bacterium]|nr:D-aminoacylase [Gemmatimonadota bacterium]